MWIVGIVENEIMNERNIKSWTCQELVRKIDHVLNQKSAIAVTFLEILLNSEDNEAYNFASDEQKELLISLQKEVKRIRVLSDELGIWLIEQNKQT